MGVIIKSGYLQLHPANRVARIISSNGNATQYFATKRHALEIGEAMIGIGITDDEWKAIREQIHASPLLDRSVELESYMNTYQGTMEELERVNEKIDNLRRDTDRGEDWKKGL